MKEPQILQGSRFWLSGKDATRIVVLVIFESLTFTVHTVFPEEQFKAKISQEEKMEYYGQTGEYCGFGHHVKNVAYSMTEVIFS